MSQNNLITLRGNLLVSGTVTFSEKETIEVKRRRQGSAEKPQTGRRAEAPVRRREGPSGPPPTGGGNPRPGGSLPGGKRLPIWLVIVLVVGYLVISLLSPEGSGDDPLTGTNDANPAPTQVSIDSPIFESEDEPVATAAVQPAATRITTQDQIPAGDEKSWTVLLFQDADDQILEQDIYVDLNEVERVGSSDQVNIVAQIDRFQGAYQGDGNWTSTRRYYVQQDSDLERLNSDLVVDLGEANMAAGETLVDFITWAVEYYPADKYALILSDHGSGWPGGWSDPNPGGKQNSRIPLVSTLDDNLFLMELDQALEQARLASGFDRFELIGMDACLMGHIEVFAALEPHARYAVASQETEPALGWAYTGFLSALIENPDMDGSGLGREIVSSYIKDDQRIVDNQARAEFLKQNSPMGGLFGASDVNPSQLAAQLSRGVTLTAVELSGLPALMDSINNFSVQLQDEDQAVVASGRSYAQSFTNIFGKQGPSPYIDLGSFVLLVQREGGSSRVVDAGQRVLDNLDRFVVAETHGSGKPGATGVSIYFPNSTLYRSPIAGAQSYTGVADRFARTSLWDDFLAFHYNDIAIKPDDRQAVIPGPGTAERAPGAGKISVSPVRVSANTTAPGSSIQMSTDITGENIGYVYFFAGYYDQGSNSIFVADTDYLESPTTREINGVYYPVWSENTSFTMSLEWEPTLFEISDGDQSALSLFIPQLYGATADETVYAVDGMYRYVSENEVRRARLYFRNGELFQVLGFSGQDDLSSPREIIPGAGDTFTILEKWYDLDSSGGIAQVTFQEGQSLTFGDEIFKIQEVFAAAGEYIVGFMVEDLDGNSQQVYQRITVQ